MAGTRRTEHAALAVPVFGALLMVPPLLSVFNVPHRLFGIPAIALYLFVIWIGMIAITAFLSRKTSGPNDEEPTNVEGDHEP